MSATNCATRHFKFGDCNQAGCGCTASSICVPKYTAVRFIKFLQQLNHICAKTQLKINNDYPEKILGKHAPCRLARVCLHAMANDSTTTGNPKISDPRNCHILCMNAYCTSQTLVLTALCFYCTPALIQGTFCSEDENVQVSMATIFLGKFLWQQNVVH